NEPIDFVIPWVDPSDPIWQEDFKRYTADPMSADARFERYRDWGLLKYWFRGVDKHAAWVNKIHFITYGHVPDWLDINHPKINIVRHQDYIPEQFLPVFSANPIELFINRIEGLAENFVYFNDDFFLTNDLNKNDFFMNGLPCDMAVFNAISGAEKVMMNIQVNNLASLNSFFSKKNVLKNNLFKWFNITYPLNYLFRSCVLLPWPTFTGFVEHHLPHAYLKSTLDEVWKNIPAQLTQTMSSKFRSVNDVNQYIFKNWQLCSGNFHPKNITKHGKYCQLADGNIDLIINYLDDVRIKMLAINDGDINDVNHIMIKLAIAFQKKWPEKSSYEV
ncbi:MAG: Stealth CR1 domain-containing protein, partial [Shewanella sp.]